MFYNIIKRIKIYKKPRETICLTTVITSLQLLFYILKEDKNADQIQTMFPYICINSYPNKLFRIQDCFNTYWFLFELLKSDIAFKRYYEVKKFHPVEIIIIDATGRRDALTVARRGATWRYMPSIQINGCALRTLKLVINCVSVCIVSGLQTTNLLDPYNR